MSAEIRLRKCRPADCETWARLNQSYLNAELAGMDKPGGPAKNRDEQHDEQYEVFKRSFYAALREPDQCSLFLIEAEEKAIGFANCMTIFSIWAHGRALVLDDLYIVADERGKGYGRQAMKQLEDFAREQDYRRIQFLTYGTGEEVAAFFRKLDYPYIPMQFHLRYL